MASQGKNGNKAAGTRAEDYVADQLDGGIRTPNEWYDVEDFHGIHEVKTTQETLSNGRSGRFRLWKDQHERLKEQDGTYHFLIDGVGYKQVPADEVDDLLEESEAGWTDAGDHRDEAQQFKLGWPYVFPDES
jgi:hypothetical protein